MPGGGSPRDEGPEGRGLRHLRAGAGLAVRPPGGQGLSSERSSRAGPSGRGAGCGGTLRLGPSLVVGSPRRLLCRGDVSWRTF